MDKPDVRALAEDVPAEVKALAERIVMDGWAVHLREVVYLDIVKAVMSDRATRETAKAEGTGAENAQVATLLHGYGLLNPDMPTQELCLHMGEVTIAEVRVARSAIGWANRKAMGCISANLAEGRRQGLEEAAAIRRAIFELLFTDECFIGTHWEAYPDASKGAWPALCAHVSSYGADAEEIPDAEVIPLWKLVEEYGKEAIQAWVCHKRGLDKPVKGELSERGRAAIHAIAQKAEG